MQITNNSYNEISYKSPNFCGHTGFERLPYYYGLRKEVTTETRLFRDYQTIKFATDYIKRVFAGAKEKNIIVGACSTGEEAYSIKMLMDKFDSKITGFDLGRNTIEKAKSGIIEINTPIDKNIKKYNEAINMDTYNDRFLIDNSPLNKEKNRLREIFKNNFEQIKPKHKFLHRLKEALIKSLDPTYIEMERKLFKIKKQDENLHFKSGDVLNLESIMPLNGTNHLFSFKNAIYHIITDNNICKRENIAPKKMKEILNKIFKDINKALNKKGLFVMGESENEQHEAMHYISKALLDNGFVPIRMPDRPYLNVWKKIREAN